MEELIKYWKNWFRFHFTRCSVLESDQTDFVIHLHRWLWQWKYCRLYVSTSDFSSPLYEITQEQFLAIKDMTSWLEVIALIRKEETNQGETT